MKVAVGPEAAIGVGFSKSAPRTHRPLTCRLRLHWMRYAGVQLGRRVERCERCGASRVRD